MTNEPSPRPWRMEEYGGDQPCCLVGADGSVVSVQYGSADAALIVDAVNERAKFEEAHMKFPDFRPVIIAAGQRDAAIAERERLRDIVRRMMEKLAVLNAGYRLMLSEGPEDAEMADLCTRTEALVREARAAIGEDAR